MRRVRIWAPVVLLLLASVRPAEGRVVRAEIFDLQSSANACDYLILADDSLDIEDHVTRYLNLHPELWRCLVRRSTVEATYPGSTRAAKIRAFVLDAYQNWSIAPSYLLLLGDADAADSSFMLPTGPSGDGYYAASPIAGQERPILHVGRIPARTTAQLDSAFSKLHLYPWPGAGPEWLGRILMLAGNGRPADPIDPLAQSLNDQIQTGEFGGWGGTLTRHNSHSFPVESPPWTATAAVRAAWDGGHGFVNALGGAVDFGVLVNLAFFNLPGAGGSGNPTFTETLDVNTSYNPVVFAASPSACAFHQAPDLSIGEDLLLSDSYAGALGVVGPTGAVGLQESYLLNRAFLNRMVTGGVRDVGRLLSAAKTEYLLGDLGPASAADQYVLLGDPATDILLSPLPVSGIFASGSEIEETPLLQDRVIAGNVTSESLRIVHTDGGVAPLGSERMLRARLTDPAGTANSIEWKLADANAPISADSVLSFWLNIPESPGGNGKIVVDGTTTSGRLKDDPRIADQNGVRLDALSRSPAPFPGWVFYYVDLGPFAGSTLSDLRLRYEAPAGTVQGNLTAYLENVRVETAGRTGSQRILNGSFEVDRDGMTPDFWTDLSGNPRTAAVERSAVFAADGTYSMRVSGAGAQQIFTTDPSIVLYLINWRARADQPTWIEVRVLDADTGTPVGAAVNQAVGTSWTQQGSGFAAPGSGPRRIQLQFVLSGVPIYFDGVETTHFAITGIPQNPRKLAAGLLGVSPNPARPGLPIRFDFSLPRDGNVSIAVYDAAGRRVLHESEEARRPSGRGFYNWRNGSSLPAGAYFARMRLDGAPIGSPKSFIVLR